MITGWPMSVKVNRISWTSDPRQLELNSGPSVRYPWTCLAFVARVHPSFLSKLYSSFALCQPAGSVGTSSRSCSLLSAHIPFSCPCTQYGIHRAIRYVRVRVEYFCAFMLYSRTNTSRAGSDWRVAPWFFMYRKLHRVYPTIDYPFNVVDYTPWEMKL